MIKKDGTAVYQRLNKQAETLQWYYFHSGIRVRVDEGYYMQVDITSSGGMLVAYRYFWTDLPLRSAYVE